MQCTQTLLLLCSVALLLCASSAVAARILGLSPSLAASHYRLGHKLLKELAARGHEVTMISQHRHGEPVKNYRHIALDGTMGRKGEKLDFVINGNRWHWLQGMIASAKYSRDMELVLEQENVQNLLSSNETFDLIILDSFYTETMYGFAHRFKCPVLGLSSTASSVWSNHLVANPAPNAYIPDFVLRFSTHMSFSERLQNAIQNIIVHMHRHFVYFPRLDAQLHQYFPDAPPLHDLMYNKTAMVLLNSHPVISDARPHVPSMVEIGGFHIDEPKPLPKDLKDFMDKATDGVILFSMGTVLTSIDLGNETRSTILKTFAKLKQQVIWKWDDEQMADKPANVKIMKWCPQNDILAHPNLKVFITHAGLLSITEAVYHGVPVIGVPVFGDQKMNVAIIIRKGFGLGINYGDLSEETLTSALNEILNNPRYRENAKQGSQVFRDHPVRPIDTAVFWTEYVIKHKGAEHLRTAAMDLQWYQLYSLDLILLVIVVDIVLFTIFYCIIKKVLGKAKKQGKRDANKKEN